MSDKLILAVPSKGRLEQDTAKLFDAAGMALQRETSRGYGGTIAGLDNLRVEYVSAGEIADRLAAGDVHLGITGEDLLRETIPDMENTVQLIAPLGFGQADVVVAVPDGWVDVETMFDLIDVSTTFYETHMHRLRVATKYKHLAADFFAKHDIENVELIQSAGATEAAPNAGLAEVIVDITSTGATLKANDLRVPKDGIILQSEANLVAALNADWSPSARETSERLQMRLTAYQKARNFCSVTFHATASEPTTPTKVILEEAIKKFGCKFQSTIYGNLAIINIIVPVGNLDSFIAFAQEKGWGEAVVTRPDFIFEKRNKKFEELIEKAKKKLKEREKLKEKMEKQLKEKVEQTLKERKKLIEKAEKKLKEREKFKEKVKQKLKERKKMDNRP